MKYKGIDFESEICARWAIFFDLLNWEWLYQPRTFEGWLPDFVLIGNGVKVFVAVVSRDFFISEATKTIDRVSFSTNERIEFLILGSQPFLNKDVINLGLLKDGYDDSCSSWVPTSLGKWFGSEGACKNKKNLYGFCHSENYFGDRITGCYDGGTIQGDLWYFPSEEYHLNNLITLWSETGKVMSQIKTGWR